ncbi:MAG: BamA/TamA family outer membrane protein, partial [Flavobacteriales bacterium]|nr:BamA/TamA family outer membrane protein [Flavobacteriales bacterium]
NLTSADPDVNSYERKAFLYNVTAPLLLFGFNVDDGIFIGGGTSFKNYGFRKRPHAMTTKISGSVAIKTGAFNFFYESHFIELIKKWDLNLDLTVLAPNSTTNYFGLGNETIDLKIEEDFNLVRFNGVDFQPTLSHMFGAFQSIKTGIGYRYVAVDTAISRFVNDASSGVPDAAFQPNHFGTITLNYTVEKIDKKVIPRRGYYFSAEAVHNVGLRPGTIPFTNLKAEAKLYIPFNYRFKTVVALRAGGATLLNDFDFYNANTLGATKLGTRVGNLRGFQRDRFSGRTIAYQNAEVRIKLFNFRSYLFPGQFGVLGYFDQGRVWTDGEKSDVWHQSYGGGFWVSPFNEAVITATYQISDEDKLLNLTLGFLF